MMKVAESGRSMIEMLGVLAIVGILSIGGITGYSKALRKVKNNQLITQMSQLVMNIRALYFTQKSFEGISEQTLINTGTVPGDMLSENSADDIIKHIYNGNVYVFQSLDATGKYGAFEVYAVGLNQDACVVLATMDWGQDPSSGFEGMYIGAADEITEPMLKDIHSPADSAPENGIFTAGMHDDAVPLGVTTALSVCSCAGNTCVIGLVLWLNCFSSWVQPFVPLTSFLLLELRGHSFEELKTYISNRRSLPSGY
jgi:Tfp pilus assembly protein PilE